MGNIFIFEDAYPELFVSHSYVDFEVADADGGHRHLITLTGVVLLKDISTLPPVDERTRPYYKGITSDAWRQDVLYLEPLLPEDLVPQGKWFDVHQCAPFVTINAIFNQDQAINAGWAVDTCELTAQLPYKIGKGGRVPIRANIAVRDSDGILYRIGYNVTLSGVLTDQPPPGPGE